MFEQKKLSLMLVSVKLELCLLLLVGLFTLFAAQSVFMAAPATVESHTADMDMGISITQQVVPNPLESGAAATYTLQVSNASTLSLPAVISDTLPDQVTPTGILTWTAVISAATTWTQQVAVTPSVNSYGPIVNEVQVTIPTSWAENLSYCTTCAEEDNVNIPLYGAGVNHFQVIATHPTYDFAEDNCDPDFSGCDLTPSAFSDVTCTSLADDGINAILVCQDADWWLPHTLAVTVGNDSGHGHRLVWHRKIVDEDSWPEVLVLYQDGNLRLKPHPSHGRADVCFGSSVIIGPAPADATRPYAEIESVVVDLAAMTLDIIYRDGGSAHLKLAVDREQAQVEVWANYDTSVSFATLRSMYVTESNADAARVKTAVSDYALLDFSSPEWTTAWDALAGPRWFFYRQVVSSHNTSAPDIAIEAVNGYVTYTSRHTTCVNQCIYLPIVLYAE